MEILGPIIIAAAGVFIALFIMLFIIEEGVRRGMRKARAEERAELAQLDEREEAG